MDKLIAESYEEFLNEGEKYLVAFTIPGEHIKGLIFDPLFDKTLNKAVKWDTTFTGNETTYILQKKDLAAAEKTYELIQKKWGQYTRKSQRGTAIGLRLINSETNEVVKDNSTIGNFFLNDLKNGKIKL